MQLFKSSFSLLLVLFLFGSFTTTVYGDDQNSGKRSTIDCSVSDYSGKNFKLLFQEAKNTSDKLCSEFNLYIKEKEFDEKSIARELQTFTDNALAHYQAIGLNDKIDLSSQFNQVSNHFSAFTLRDMAMPELRTLAGSRMGDSRDRIQFTAIGMNPVNYSNDAPCVSSSQEDCKTLINEYSEAFNAYRSAYNSLYDNEALLKHLNKEWDRFLEASKSQTALEVLLTTYANGKHFKKNHLVGPPPFQIIALHPDLVYNKLENGEDGNATEFGMAIEWIGINFWDWKVPLGLSVASVYVDRAGVKDVGKGFQIHINNKYTIGWADHDEDDSVYVTLDLLKLVQNKKAQYEKYHSLYFD